MDRFTALILRYSVHVLKRGTINNKQYTISSIKWLLVNHVLFAQARTKLAKDEKVKNLVLTD